MTQVCQIDVTLCRVLDFHTDLMITAQHGRQHDTLCHRVTKWVLT